MSNIIPMVSSSPPPMDEGGGFDWDDDDDDFGTFTSASDSSFVQSGVTAVNQDSPFKSPLPDQFNGGQCENDFGDFANFETHSENEPQESVNPHCLKNLSSEQRPESIHIEHKSNEFEKNDETNSESDCYQTTNGPLVDSGVYSSNVSPVQHIESSGSDKDQVHNSEDNCKSARNENVQDNSKPLAEEKNKQNKEMLNEETSIHEDANLSVTQETDKNIAETETVEQNDSLKESNQCIPPASIPENDNVHESGSNQPEKNLIVETHKNEDDNAEVVISNCDELHCENSNTPGSKSTENSNSNSVSSVDSQEFECSQNACLSEPDEDLKDKTLQNDTELPAENSADFKGSLDFDERECDVKLSGVPLQRTESEPGVNIVSDKVMTEEGRTLEEIACNTSTDGEKFSQIQTEIVTEADISENAESDKINKSVRNEEIGEQLTEKNVHEGAELKQMETNTLSNCSESKDDIKDVTNSTETPDTEMTCVNDAISDSEIQNGRIDNEFSQSTNVEPLENGDDSVTSINNHLIENTVPVTNTNTNLNDQDLSDVSPTNEIEKSGGIEDNGNDFGDFSKTSLDAEGDFGDFNASLNDNQITVNNVDEADDEFGDFNSSFERKRNVSDSDVDKADEDFGDFNAVCDDNKEQLEEGFGDFNATFDSMPTSSDQISDDWAAFSEPQIADSDKIEDEEDEWAGFEEEDSIAKKEFEDVTSQNKMESEKVPPSEFANMTKHEKLLYAVTTCFPALVAGFEVNDLEQSDLNELQIESDSPVWGQVKGLNTTDALSYQWTKSLWNTQLFSTLHIDTRNILIGHKKAPVPVFAAGLTLLEPTKGQAPLKPDILVDTSKSDSSHDSHTQIPTTSVQTPNKNESIPAAQFDWSTSGLTNPLEANNKTLNLDFLIQDQATKSNALESEFLSTNDSPVHKPAIQPLENILANLKTSSTFKPTIQNEDIGKEASKVVQSLPDLVFMKSKVLMFPVKLGGFEN